MQIIIPSIIDDIHHSKKITQKKESGNFVCIEIICSRK
jgi:hypothetical protein